MSTQPEALRLAAFIGSEMPVPNWAKYEAATELRRLHKVNAELVEALKEIAESNDDNWQRHLANTALAKAKRGDA